MDVIVAGGGPARLMTAALLAAAGAGARERGSEPARQSRGTAMHPRTLEVLTMIDAGDGRRISDVLPAQRRRVPDAASPSWNWLPRAAAARTHMQRTASRSSRP